MARLYADEQFLLPVVELLRAFSHDVLTVQEAGKAGLEIPDIEALLWHWLTPSSFQPSRFSLFVKGRNERCSHLFSGVS